MRNPLNSLIGSIDILNEQESMNRGTSVNKKKIKILSSAKFSGEILRTLINNILDFSKLRVGKMVNNLNSIDLRETILNLLNMFEPFGQKERNSIRKLHG